MIVALIHPFIELIDWLCAVFAEHYDPEEDEEETEQVCIQGVQTSKLNQ